MNEYGFEKPHLNQSSISNVPLKVISHAIDELVSSIYFERERAYSLDLSAEGKTLDDLAIIDTSDIRMYTSMICHISIDD